VGFEPDVRAEVLALPPGHPYLRLPLRFSLSLEPRLQRLVPAAELVRLRQAAEAEIADPSRWGTTFTLIQTWARCRAPADCGSRSSGWSAPPDVARREWDKAARA
jgi:hypothetical protein